MTRRLIASGLTAVLLAGAFAPAVLAQQAAPQIAQASPAAPSAGTVHYRRRTGTDAYDVGAGVLTVLKAPFNVLTCGLGGAVGAALFVATLGSAYKATARVVEEGCGGPWLIRGDDLRPDRLRPDASDGQ
jgi:hypothetical protein